VLLFAAVGALFLVLVWWLRALTVPLVIALLGAALLYPLHRWLLGRGLPAAGAAGATCAALVVSIGGTGWALVAILSDNAHRITDALRHAADKLNGDFAGGAPARAADGLGDLGGRFGSALASGVVSGLGIAAQLLTGAALALALTFFMLRDGHRVGGVVRSFTPVRHADTVTHVLDEAFAAVSGYMRGTTLIALIDATFIAIGLVALRVPSAIGLAALVFVGAYVPYIGAFLSGVVAVLVAFADRGLGIALGVLGVVLAVQVIEGNILQPTIHSRTVALHPAVVMAAVAAGAGVAGILGTLIAVPVVAVLTAIVRYARSRLAHPGAPAEEPG
jgi:predicted PurR-regulated permease PerM